MRYLAFTVGLWLTAVVPVLAAAPVFPALTGRVVDTAQLLDAATKQQLDIQLAALEQQTGDQLVVVTVPSLEGQEIEEYGYQLGRSWKIGQTGKDNGALLIVAPNERAVRIEVGYGLEDRLTDALSRLIIERAILPRFKAGDYPGGIMAGVNAIQAVIGGTELPAELKRQPETDGLPLSFIVPIILLFLVLRLFARRGGRGAIGSAALPFLLGGFLGGRGRGGDDDGGGFSGGGGGFGGGGASGRW